MPIYEYRCNEGDFAVRGGTDGRESYAGRLVCPRFRLNVASLGGRVPPTAQPV